MQVKLFQRCTYFLYCSVLSLGGKINTRRISQPDMESIFTKIIYEIFWSYELNYSLNFKNYQNSMLLTSSDTKRTLMHLFLFTNSAQRERKLRKRLTTLLEIVQPGIFSENYKTQIIFHF